MLNNLLNFSIIIASYYQKMLKIFRCNLAKILFIVCVMLLGFSEFDLLVAAHPGQRVAAHPGQRVAPHNLAKPNPTNLAPTVNKSIDDSKLLMLITEAGIKAVIKNPQPKRQDIIKILLNAIKIQTATMSLTKAQQQLIDSISTKTASLINDGLIDSAFELVYLSMTPTAKKLFADGVRVSESSLKSPQTNKLNPDAAMIWLLQEVIKCHNNQPWDEYIGDIAVLFKAYMNFFKLNDPKYTYPLSLPELLQKIKVTLASASPLHDWIDYMMPQLNSKDSKIIELKYDNKNNQLIQRWANWLAAPQNKLIEVWQPKAKDAKSLFENGGNKNTQGAKNNVAGKKESKVKQIKHTLHDKLMGLVEQIGAKAVGSVGGNLTAKADKLGKLF